MGWDGLVGMGPERSCSLVCSVVFLQAGSRGRKRVGARANKPAAGWVAREEAELHGSGWQLQLMAKPEHQVRGVLVVGSSRCGKSHVGHQLFAVLPQGAWLHELKLASHA